MEIETKNFVPNKAKAAKLVRRFDKVFSEDKLRFSALPGATTNWSPEKLVLLYRFASDENQTQQDLADRLGVDRSGISRKCNSMDWEKFERTLEMLLNMSFEDAIKFEAERKQKSDIVKSAVRDRNKLIEKESFYSGLTKAIVEANKIIKIKTSEPTVLKRISKGKRTPEHMVLLLSDLHVGQEFDLQETGGINQYNLKVFNKRAATLKKSLVEIYDIHSESYRIPELHIFGLGDMVNGGNMNGEWGAASNSHMDVAKQAITAFQTIAEMIQDWKRYFEKISFTGVIGNHGRAGVTKNSDPIGANWDKVTYALLESTFRNDPHVSISYSETWWAQRSVLGTEFLLVHGDYCGNSINSLMALDQKMRSITSKVKGLKPFNILCMGHFHSNTDQETPMGRIMVNGSFPGSDMHSLQHLKTGSRPTQRLFGVHPIRGLTWNYWLDMEKYEKAKGSIGAKEK